MNNFTTIEGVMELFRNVNCIGQENCIFVASKDTNREGMKYGALGAIGGVAGAVASFSSGMVDGLSGFDGLLINQTENGLGIIPLSSKSIQLVLKMEKLEPQLDKFVFIPNSNIESIIVKNFSILNKKLKKVKIKSGGKTLHLLARVSEKEIPYQQENFSKFMNKYKKGGAPQLETSIPSQPKTEENLINNNQEKEKFANQALNILMANHIISDYNDIGCEYGYLYKIEGHGYEGLFKIKKLERIYYFAVQGDNLQMVNLDEQHFEAYKQSFLQMHNN